MKRRIVLVCAVLWMSVRDRWFMSRWNPWGAASGRTMPAQDIVDIIERHGQGWMNTLTGTGTDQSPPKPPNGPIQ